MLTPETGLPEIQDRSISGLFGKLRTGSLTAADIAANYVDLPGVLLTFVNEQKTRAGRETLGKVVAILRAVSDVHDNHPRMPVGVTCWPNTALSSSSHSFQSSSRARR